MKALPLKIWASCSGVIFWVISLYVGEHGVLSASPYRLDDLFLLFLDDPLVQRLVFFAQFMEHADGKC